ncbi:ACP S-malonyltransferase [Legionella spiritensis]|uniref:Malonyl CoA-acyl carrier protein transacylase n=1 Tax=Legionella spiritensis TaxID=452 RepID=A0A0W0Z5M6_LEGSP|nr:ACP S-malonyltransferase [Legionella spiritensis]KTD64022.1 malonyl CoA-ACP transacylase [Legionella spiritensis]SNV37239.1 (acyl-carrier-protein) S-malonyltransferase [Legionella spiritensis]
MSSLAYVFPGQGSQSVGMLQDLAEKQAVVRDCFHQVSDILGYDLWSLVQQGPESKLNQTEYTQAAMLTADVAIYEVLRKSGMPQAELMAGHSLGEYAALTCAGAISLSDAAVLVTRRGQLMQQYVPVGQGAMAAIVGLNDEDVQHLCAESSNGNEVVTPANFNAIGQTVIAGHTNAVEKAINLAIAMDARLARIIPVSVPCHCPLLADAALEFTDYLAETGFHIPHTSVISNVDLSIYHSPEQIRTLLKKQLYSPVRWVETIQQMKEKGIQSFIECGPGKVLSGLIKRIDRSLNVMSVYDQHSLEQVLSVMDLNGNNC